MSDQLLEVTAMTGRRHRRTATGRPPVERAALHERDSLPPPAHSNAPQADERPGVEVEVDVEALNLPGAAPASSWRPRPTSPRELDDARTALVVHRWDADTGRCAACHDCCPCRQAQAAARVLAQAGAWNTVPFTGPADWRTDQEPPGREPGRAGGGWLARLMRRLPWTAATR